MTSISRELLRTMVLVVILTMGIIVCGAQVHAQTTDMQGTVQGAQEQPSDHVCTEEHIVLSENTCTEPGHEIIRCSICGDVKKEITTGPTGHWNYIITNPAQVGACGNECKQCLRCGKVVYEIILPALKPSPSTTSQLKALKKGIMVKWKKKDCDGYQIRYSLKSSMSGAKMITLGKASTVSKKLTKLKAKKKYYVQIRTYKVGEYENIYSAWSTKKSVTTK